MHRKISLCLWAKFGYRLHFDNCNWLSLILVAVVDHVGLIYAYYAKFARYIYPHLGQQRVFQCYIVGCSDNLYMYGLYSFFHSLLRYCHKRSHNTYYLKSNEIKVPLKACLLTLNLSGLILFSLVHAFSVIFSIYFDNNLSLIS